MSFYPMHIVKTIVPYNDAFQCHVDDLKTLALGSFTFFVMHASADVNQNI